MLNVREVTIREALKLSANLVVISETISYTDVRQYIDAIRVVSSRAPIADYSAVMFNDRSVLIVAAYGEGPLYSEVTPDPQWTAHTRIWYITQD